MVLEGKRSKSKEVLTRKKHAWEKQKARNGLEGKEGQEGVRGRRRSWLEHVEQGGPTPKIFHKPGNHPNFEKTRSEKAILPPLTGLVWCGRTNMHYL